MDRIYIWLRERRGKGVDQPEFRLRTFQLFGLQPSIILTFVVASMFPGTILLPIGLLMTGWAAQNHVHWVVTDLVSFRLFCIIFFRSGKLTGIHRELHSSAPG
jgi:hypothetical protein